MPYVHRIHSWVGRTAISPRVVKGKWLDRVTHDGEQNKIKSCGVGKKRGGKIGTTALQPGAINGEVGLRGSSDEPMRRRVLTFRSRCAPVR